jgi:Flp pilus assembly protein TadG
MSSQWKLNRRSRGQNLVEMALTFPFILLLILFMVEMGRVWFTYEGAKMAATEGAHAASMYHNPNVGKNLLDQKLAVAGLKVQSATVSQIPNKHAYEADVTVRFTPLYGELSIPTVGGKVSFIPAGFNITYTAVDDVALY